MKNFKILALLPLLLVTACKKEIFGRLIVTKEFTVNNRVESGGIFSSDKYEIQKVPVGNWKGSLKFEDDVNVWLLIEDSISKKVSPFKLTEELKKAFESEHYDGTYWLYAHESGQPIDAKIAIATQVQQGPTQYARESCSAQVPVQVQVCSTDPQGHTHCHWETRWTWVQGYREVQYHVKSVDKAILTSYFIAGETEPAATMDLKDHEDHTIVEHRSPCYPYGPYPPQYPYRTRVY